MYLLPRQRYGKPVIARAVNGWIDIDAPAHFVFRHMTEADLLTDWWANRCTSEPRPGGKLHFEWDGEAATTGDAFFRQFEAPVRIAIEWTHANGEALVPDGSNHRGMRWPALNIYELWQFDPSFTRVHVHDMGIATDAKYSELFNATVEGWTQSLSRLKKAVERGR